MRDMGFHPSRHTGAHHAGHRASGAAVLAAALLILVALTSWPATALAEETTGAECASIAAQGTEKQMNLGASETLVKCGVLPAGSSEGPSGSPLTTLEPAFPGSDVDTITGTETYPHVTQSESSVWSHASTVVVNYNDSRGATESPKNLSGVSVSTNSGATFTRLGTKSPFTGHVNNDGDPILVYNNKLAKWFAGDLVAGEGTGSCGVKGIGLWTSTNAETWTVGACAHTGSNDDRESMWVDNNAASPFYGRMYVSFNNFAVGGGALEVTHSDNGTTWSTPAALTTTFRRNVQLTGSPSSDGTVFVAGQEENGGGVGNVGQQNYMYRSTNGGVTWTSTTMGAKFTIAGSKSCGYFPAIPPIWRETGWGQPAVGPNGVVQYDYAAHGTGSDESDIFYVRSTDNGVTWSAPVRLNTDSAGKAQWQPSLRVSPSGVVEASWYDRRNSTNGENYQRFARISHDNGVTWGPDEPLSTILIPQPTQPDPNVQACYAGDYNYTTATTTTGFDTWTDGRVSIEGKPVQKVFFHSISLLSGPTAITEPATGVTKTGATLNGTVNPNGVETKYYFEYGLKAEKYEHKTAEASAGSGTSNLKESQAITGLTVNTPYHFRIVATNSNKITSEGSDLVFTTLPNAPENTVLPVASPETPVQGFAESSSTGTWTNGPTGYKYHWERCNATGGECNEEGISGATSSTYTPVAEDVGHTLRVKVTAENGGGSNSAHSKATHKVQAIGEITEYSLNSGDTPIAITSGPDGNLWFNGVKGGLAKIPTSGSPITEYSLFFPSEQSTGQFAAGPDGNVWFSIRGNRKAIGKITPTGTITEYPLPAGHTPGAITPGPDGNMWFAIGPEGSLSEIGKITTSGAITEYALPEFSDPAAIVAGPDGNLWFAEYGSHKIGKITTGGTVTEYSIPSIAGPLAITAVPTAIFGMWRRASERSLLPAGSPNMRCPKEPVAGVSQAVPMATCGLRMRSTARSGRSPRRAGSLSMSCPKTVDRMG